MSLLTRSQAVAAAAGAALALVAFGGVVFGSSQAATHLSARQGINAQTLNGYRASQLVRATAVRDGSVMDNFVTSPCAFRTVKVLRVTNPGAGFLMVSANVVASRDASFPNNEALAARLKLGTQVSIEAVTRLELSGGIRDSSLSLQAAFKATQGKQNVLLQLSACDADAAAYVFGRAISALYVPFGSSSVVSLGGKLAARNR